ncbi:hypothetical protein GCM10010170_097990 [Dactylosporangium salmoneum]|uniref:Uncharacterized protein n=1 Tax=Dactylosporangium salmoneum TaxID=53361 RepID=A0ABN3HTU8_9ACTN
MAGDTAVSSSARRRSARPTTAENGYGGVTGTLPFGGSAPARWLGLQGWLQRQRPESPDSRIAAGPRPSGRDPAVARALGDDSPVTVAGPSRNRTGFLRIPLPVIVSHRPQYRQRDEV